MPETIATIDNFTHNQFKEVFDYTQNEFFPWLKKHGYVGYKFDPFFFERKVDWSPKRIRSLGGDKFDNEGRHIYFASLGMSSFMNRDCALSDGSESYYEKSMFSEYKHIRFRDDIGTVEGHWTTCVTALICHEMAHAIDFFLNYENEKDALDAAYEDSDFEYSHSSKKSLMNGHGRDWQFIYYILRERFVNRVADGYKFDRLSSNDYMDDGSRFNKKIIGEIEINSFHFVRAVYHTGYMNYSNNSYKLIKEFNLAKRKGEFIGKPGFRKGFVTVLYHGQIRRIKLHENELDNCKVITYRR